jgi:hypothetical protein
LKLDFLISLISALFSSALLMFILLAVPKTLLLLFSAKTDNANNDKHSVTTHTDLMDIMI